MSVLLRRVEDMKRAVSRYPTAYLKVDNLVIAAREAERDRIIALLEQYPWREQGDFEYLIALIKGENK